MKRALTAVLVFVVGSTVAFAGAPVEGGAPGGLTGSIFGPETVDADSVVRIDLGAGNTGRVRITGRRYILELPQGFALDVRGEDHPTVVAASARTRVALAAYRVDRSAAKREALAQAQVTLRLMRTGVSVPVAPRANGFRSQPFTLRPGRTIAITTRLRVSANRAGGVARIRARLVRGVPGQELTIVLPLTVRPAG